MRTVITILICFVLIQGLNAQERALLYSHYTFNGLAINPAYTGSHEMLSVSISHRTQWVGFEGAPSYNIAGIHTPIKNTRMGLGLLIMNESIGLRKYTGIYLNYAYRIKLGTGKLALGLKGGIGSGKIDPVELGQDDYIFSEKTNNYVLPNFGIGAYYYTGKFYAGLSIPVILGYRANNAGEITVYHQFNKYAYYLNAGITFNVSDNWKIQPSGLVVYDQAGGIVADGGLSLLYKDLLRAGATYRSKNAIVMLIDCKITYQLRVGIAYDYGMSALNDYNRSSYEIALEYNFGYKIKTSDPTKF
jgi:type IX secretion system PorP/SprF family membrane protein